MVVFPNIKINIGLSITSKRPDGFHNIESVFYPVPWTEVLEVVSPGDQVEADLPAHVLNTVDQVNFYQYGDPIPGDADRNLCIQVYQKLQTWYNLPAVDMHLLKTLPIGAGLGGGSADAAFALRALKDFFDLHISDVEAMDLLAELGSDCPFFWKNKPMFVFGRGEKMRPIALDLSGYYIVLVYPGIHVSTKEAYSGVVPKDPIIDLELLPDLPIEQWREAVVNDFEGSVFVQYPVLAELKQQLYDLGADYAAMTGSGSTIFGLFKTLPELPEAWRKAPFIQWSGKLTA
jgi:4-diphosphocytidyl-2-C-methyl-D-erythritol kinase